MIQFGDSRLPERFWNKVRINEETGCWEWQGAKNTNGYGTFAFEGKTWVTHRLFYELVYGTLEDGLECDHICRCRHCLCLDHLEPVTHLENIRRGEAGKHFAMRTHCPKGHEYSEDNTYIRHLPGGGTGRGCRECDRIKGRKQAQKRSLERKTNPRPARTHCKHGHELTPENSYIRQGTKACLGCRACGRNRVRKSKAVKNALVALQAPWTRNPALTPSTVPLA